MRHGARVAGTRLRTPGARDARAVHVLRPPQSGGILGRRPADSDRRAAAHPHVRDGPGDALPDGGHADGNGHAGRNGPHRRRHRCGAPRAETQGSQRGDRGLPRADRRAGGCAADHLALGRRSCAGDVPRGRYHEDQQPGIRHPGNERRIWHQRRRGRAPAPFGAERRHARLIRLGGAGRPVRPPRHHPAVRRDVHRHFHLRSHAVLSLEPLHVLPHGGLRGRHAAGGLRPPRGDHADAPSRLESRPHRGRGHPGGLSGGIRHVGLLQPVFGWRIMWFLNLPSGLLLIALSPLIPESARFLLHIGRPREARATLARFGSVVVREADDWDEEAELDHSHLPPTDTRYLGTTLALTVTALSWGLLSYGVLLWLPGQLIAEGHDMGVAAAIIARSTFISVPVIVFAALLYSRWSTKGALLVMIGISEIGLLALVLRESGVHAAADPVIALTLLIVGSTGVISILLPYTAESYPIRIRGRATGWVAGVSKSGGFVCQGLSSLALVPAIGTAALETAVPVLLGLALLSLYG